MFHIWTLVAKIKILKWLIYNFAVKQNKKLGFALESVIILLSFISCDEVAISNDVATTQLAWALCHRMIECEIKLPLGTETQCYSGGGFGYSLASNMIGYNHIMKSQEKRFNECLDVILHADCGVFLSGGRICEF